jgi:hypothetical protein
MIPFPLPPFLGKGVMEVRGLRPLRFVAAHPWRGPAEAP